MYISKSGKEKHLVTIYTEIILLMAHAQVKAHPLFLYIEEFFYAELSYSHKGPLPTFC